MQVKERVVPTRYYGEDADGFMRRYNVGKYDEIAETLRRSSRSPLMYGLKEELQKLAGGYGIRSSLRGAQSSK